eukprot:SAG25_NODE_1937_length_2123_cov_1.853261_2_plen_59_part_01
MDELQPVSFPPVGVESSWYQPTGSHLPCDEAGLPMLYALITCARPSAAARAPEPWPTLF